MEITAGNHSLSNSELLMKQLTLHHSFPSPVGPGAGAEAFIVKCVVLIQPHHSSREKVSAFTLESHCIYTAMMLTFIPSEELRWMFVSYLSLSCNDWPDEEYKQLFSPTSC